MSNPTISAAKWRSPSNIAIVKYWGKHGNQVPANPSISFTLNNCFTETELKINNQITGAQVWLDGEREEAFDKKVNQFLERIAPLIPEAANHGFEVHTHNSFPHSSGIASSASGMSALALCIASIFKPSASSSKTEFLQLSSDMARLGSGSASRSVYGGFVEWGHSGSIPISHDEYAIPLKGIHAHFNTICDTILLVDKGQKQVSSTVGHGLLKGHPFASRRFEQANQNVIRLLEILRAGDREAFGELAESEALTLHSLMMSSIPNFILMRPGTLSIIEAIRAFRQDSKLPVYFTLDAGANVHLLYFQENEQSVMNFIQSNLVQYCENGQYICDAIGNGPEQIHD